MRTKQAVQCPHCARDFVVTIKRETRPSASAPWLRSRSISTASEASLTLDDAARVLDVDPSALLAWRGTDDALREVGGTAAAPLFDADDVCAMAQVQRAARREARRRRWHYAY